jgi:hypothetical protein
MGAIETHNKNDAGADDDLFLEPSLDLLFASECGFAWLHAL